MMKRLSAILLAVLLVCTAIAMPSSAEEALEAEGVKTELSIPENIKRILEFLDLIDEDSVSGSALVSYEDFYAVCGKLSGIPSGELKNESYVTYMYVIRNLVSVLGYDAYAQVKGDYPYSYIAVANELDLLDGIELNGYEQAVDYDAFYLMLYNALTTDMYQIDGITGTDSGYDYSYIRKGTLLEEIFDITSAEGVLNGTEKSDLYGDILDENEIKIDGIVMKYEGENVHHLLGHRVEYFYDAKASIPTVLFMTEHDEQEITTVYSDEIISFTGASFVYAPAESSSEKKINIPVGTVVLKNGVFAGYTGTFDVSAVLSVERGKIDFINNDNQKGIDCISMTEYSVRVVDSANSALEILYFKNNLGMLSLGEEYTLSGKEVEYSIRLNGDAIALDAVYEWDAALIASAESKSGKLFYDIEIVRQRVSGTVSAIGEDCVYIDDVRYGLAPSLNLDKLKLGHYGDFVIAGNNEVADVRMLRAYTYGFLMGVKNNDGIDNTAMLKVMSEAGKTEILTLSDKVRFNGASTQAGDVSAQLKDTYILIAYKLGTDGKITTIYTDRGIGKVENEFSMDADHTKIDNNLTGYDRFDRYRTDAFFYSEPFFNGLYQPASDCVIFYVHPSVIDANEAPEDDRVKVGGSTSITSTINVTTTTDDAIVRAQMFDTDDFYRAGAIVIYHEDVAGGNPANGYSSVMLIDSVTTALIDGEELYKIRYYKDGSVETETAYAEPSKLYKAGAYSDFPFKHHDKITSFADLRCGDVIQASVDKKGYISSWRPVFLINMEYDEGDYWTSGTNYYNNAIEMFRTKIKSVDETNWIALSIDSTGAANDRFFRLTKGDSAECFVYDSKKNELTMYPDMSIVNELVPGAEVFTVQTYKRTMMHMVIK